MQTRPLGRTGLEVSRLCLGTMTFGEQNSEAEAHEQLDRAVAFGINFIDTAEMYPVPPMAKTQGLTERASRTQPSSLNQYAITLHAAVTLSNVGCSACRCQ